MGTNFVDQLIMPPDVGQVQSASAASIAINSAGMPRGIKRRQTTADYRSHPFSRPMEVRESFKRKINYSVRAN